MMPFRPPMLRPRGPPIMYPRFPMRPPLPPLCSPEQNVLLNLLHGMVLPEEDLEVLRQMVGRNTRQSMMPVQQNGVAVPLKRPRIEE